MEGLEFVLRFAAFVILVFADALTAYRIALALLPRTPTLVRAGATMVAGAWLATVAFHAVASIHLFRLDVALLGAAALIGLTLRSAAGRAELARAARRDARVLRRLAGLQWRSPRRLVVLTFALAASTTILRPFVVPPLGWDALTYHGVKAGLWVQRHGFAFLDGPSTWACSRNFFGGAEVLWAWTMVPFHSDLLSLVAEPLQWLGAGLFVFLLARALGVKEPASSIAAGTVLALPPLRMLVGSGYVEVLQSMYMAAAFASAVRWARGGRGGDWLVCAAAAGLASGVKANGLALGALLLATAGLFAVRRLARKELSWPVAGLGLFAFLAGVGPWLVYNIADTGFPLSPLPVRIFGVTLGVSNPELDWYMTRDLTPWTFATEWPAVTRTFAFEPRTNEALSLFSLVLLVVFVALWVPLVRRRRFEGLFFGALVATTVAGVYNRDFTTVRVIWPESASRFWIPAFIAAVPGALAARTGTRAVGHLFLGISLWQLARLSFVGQTLIELTGEAAVAGASVLVFLIGRALWRRTGRLLEPALAVGTALLLLVSLLGAFRSQFRYRIAREAYAIHPVPKAVAPLSESLDDVDTPKRIAVTGGAWQNLDRWFGYQLLGSSLQNELVYVPPTADGAVHPQREIAKLADARAWLRRLDDQRVTHVVSFEPESLELRWMAGMPERFEVIAASGWYVAMRVVPPDEASAKSHAPTGSNAPPPGRLVPRPSE